MKTMLPSGKSLRSLCIAGAVALASTLSSHALLIDFEPPGYVSGNILGGSGATGGTVWSGSQNSLVITAGAGKDTSQALVLKASEASSSRSNFTPSAAELPDFDPTESTLKLDFSFRFVEAPINGEGGDETIAYLQIGNTGSTPAARVTLFSNGALGYHVNNANPVKIPTAQFQATDTETWYDVSVLLDYKSQSYSLRVNGELLTDAGVFRTLTTGTHTAALSFLTFGGDNHKEVAFDNISLTVIPEPGSVSLLLGGATLGALMLKLRGRHSAK